MKSAYLIIAALLLSTAYASASSSVQANVIVACPFKIALSALADYPLLGTAHINFTINSLDSCTSPSLPGYFSILSSSSGNVLYQKSISSGIISPTPVEYDYTFNTLALGNITAIAKVNFTNNGYSNQSEKTFQILNPANVIVTSITSQSQIIQNSPMQVFISLLNKGQYASGNILLNFSISGPRSSVFSVNATALSPGQSENVTVTLLNATISTGSYTANVFAVYYYGNTLKDSSTKQFTYSVVAQSSPAQSTSGGSVGTASTGSPIAGLSILSTPLYVTLLDGTSSISSISLQNTGNAQETVTISIPSAFSNLLSVSADNLTIQPGDSITVDLLFNAPKGAISGRYIIPVNITTSSGLRRITQTEYVASSIYSNSSSNLVLLNQINMINNSDSAAGLLSIQNPQGENLSNIMLETSIPSTLVQNISQISTYGLPATIAAENGRYVITWSAGSLPKGSDVYAYYTIQNITTQTLLAKISNFAALPSQESPQNLLKIVNVNVPIVYTNSTATLQVDMLYTGTTPEPILFVLGGSSSIFIKNNTQSVNASPNDNIVRQFEIQTGPNPSTVLLTLYVYSANANLSYSIPLVVLPKTAEQSTQIVVETGGAQQSQLSHQDIAALSLVGVVILAAALVYIAKVGSRRVRYNPDRAYKLKRLSDKIDTEE